MGCPHSLQFPQEKSICSGAEPPWAPAPGAPHPPLTLVFPLLFLTLFIISSLLSLSWLRGSTGPCDGLVGIC